MHMTNRSACITWRISMLILTIALVTFFVFAARNKNANNFDGQITDLREDIFTILNQHDPDQTRYDDYEDYKAKALKDKAFWAAEWDALEPGTTIGFRRGNAMHYTGYPKEIHENLERLNEAIRYGIPSKRLAIVRDRLEAEEPLVEYLALDPGSTTAQELTTLVAQHDTLVQQQDNNFWEFNPFWMFVTTLSPLFMVFYAFTGFIPPQFIENRWPE